RTSPYAVECLVWSTPSAGHMELCFPVRRKRHFCRWKASSFHGDTHPISPFVVSGSKGRDLHGGRLPPSVGDNTHHSGTQMPLRGHQHHQVSDDEVLALLLFDEERMHAR